MNLTSTQSDMVYRKFANIEKKDARDILQKVINSLEEDRHNTIDVNKKQQITDIEDIADLYMRNFDNIPTRTTYLTQLVQSPLMGPYLITHSSSSTPRPHANTSVQ